MKKLIRFDWAMKRLLRNKANFVILEGFLSELLFEDVKIQKILESESNREDEYDKLNRVDLLVENSKGELVIIEVQNNREWDFISRLLYGTCKVITENITQGMKYKEVKKVISISIVYFDLGQGEDYIYKGTTKFVGIHNKDELKLSKEEQKAYEGKEKVEEIYPEYYIIKVNQFNEVAKNTLDEWIYFLKTEEIKGEFKAKGLEEAKKELDVMKLPEKDQKTYSRYLESMMYEASTLGLERELGKLEGKEEGIKIGIEKIALNMKKSGMSIDEISKITGLNKKDIEKL